MPLMLNMEVGIDCSITHSLYMKVRDMDVTYVHINLLCRVTSPLIYSLYIRKGDFNVTCVNIQLLTRVVLNDTYIEHMKE